MKFIKKIKKFKEEIISGFLVAVIFVSPFINMGRFNKNKGSTSKTIFSVSASPSPLETESNDQVINKSTGDFVLEVNGVKSVYNFVSTDWKVPEYLNNDAICNEIIDFDSNDVRSIYDKTIELVNQIKDNSNSYLNKKSGYISAFLTDIESKYHLDQIATQEILKDVISGILKDSTNKDICLIKNLRFVISYDNSNESFVYYSEKDSLLVVYPNNVRSVVDNKKVFFWDTLKYAMQCEFNKIRQCNCKCDKNENSFPYKTISDAALVSELYNLGKTEKIIFDSNVEYERLILALGLFGNFSISDYYNSIYSNDVKGFYNFCGVNNSSDIYTINKILYTMDVINDKNSTESIISKIGYDYRVDAFGMIISDMIMYTSSNADFSLKDNLIMFNIIKNLVVNNVSYDYYDDAFENISKLNDLYIEFLSKHYNTTVDKILNLENSDKILNYSLAVIDICNKNIYYDDLYFDYISYSSKLVERFPLLRQILANSSINSSDYYKFIKNGNKFYGLIKKK